MPVRAEGTEITGVAPAPDGVWLASATGEVLRAGRKGELLELGPKGLGAERRSVRGPFDYVDLAADPAADGTWVVRSQQQFSYNWYQGEVPPVLVHVDRNGEVTGQIGASIVPAHVLLTDLANAGRMVVDSGTIFYAPFIRDEVVAFTATGDALWIASRELSHSRPDPKFEIVDGTPVIDYAPVNLGVAIGPDDRLYVLSTVSDSTGRGRGRTRVDVFDKASGHLLRSGEFATLLPTVAVDGDGRVYSLDSFRLLTGVAPRERQALAAFDLERLSGGRMTLTDLIGRVTLINFWASWCGPCRTEMPALDSLQKNISDPEFGFVTFNEDLNVDAAKAFIEAFGFGFPVLLGRGKLRGRYHYVGLPFTALVDRQGRVVQRWLGFAGEAQFNAIRALIRAELARGGRPGAHSGHHGHGP